MTAKGRSGKRLLPILSLASICACAGLQDAAAADIARGELLYGTHCVACHTTQMHWRDQRLAKDWKSLNAQVRRWQDAVQLNWDDEDIASTASYLNRLYYQFPEPPEQKVFSSK